MSFYSLKLGPMTHKSSQLTARSHSNSTLTNEGMSTKSEPQQSSTGFSWHMSCSATRSSAQLLSQRHQKTRQQRPGGVPTKAKGRLLQMNWKSGKRRTGRDEKQKRKMRQIGQTSYGRHKRKAGG